MTGLPVFSERLRPSSEAPSPAWYSSGYDRPWPRAIKRILDIAISLTSLVVLAPLFGAIALLIALDSPGDVFYRQPRLGRHGLAFELIKFRTMYQDADQVLDKLLLDPRHEEEWQRYQKLRDDPRITAVGRLLRRFGLDELPQLWNVLHGEMSLVGPRPILLNQRIAYGDSYGYYIQILPGITGLWQVSGGNRLPFARRVQLDTEYARTWSIWKDLDILLRTPRTVLLQDGLC